MRLVSVRLGLRFRPEYPSGTDNWELPSSKTQQIPLESFHGLESGEPRFQTVVPLELQPHGTIQSSHSRNLVVVGFVCRSWDGHVIATPRLSADVSHLDLYLLLVCLRSLRRRREFQGKLRFLSVENRLDIAAQDLRAKLDRAALAPAHCTNKMLSQHAG